MSNYKPNKGRRPFPKGTRVDVVLRNPSFTNGEEKRLGRDCGIFDWSIEGVTGDILRYRKSEEQGNE